MNQHAPFRELLAARLDRPLTRVELRSLTAHLKRCESCRQADADYRTQRNLLRALPPPPVPRDLWARTSAALDREVARGVRSSWGRRLRRARRNVVPASAMMSTIAAVSVVAALAALQLAPASVPSTSEPNRPTPFAVAPQAFAFVGMGSTDLAVYRMIVTQVCPHTAPLDCVPTNRIVRTPIGVGLANDIHAGNIALSPTGRQLAFVGRNTRHDVIAVVMMPDDDGTDAIPPESVGLPDSTQTPDDQPTPTPEATAPPETPPADPTANPTEPTGSPGPTDTPAPQTPAVSEPPSASPSDGPTAEPAATPTTSPSRPPQSAVPGLAVLNILENVRSAGSPPAWSLNSEMLAFSAMPVDGSHGPDVYVWSPSDTQARPITTDHSSYFASWSGNRIVVSRLGVVDDDVVERNVVIDPETLEERRAAAGPVWLPAVNAQRTLAVVWHGQLDIADGQPDPRSGALYLMDWSGIDPFHATEPGDVDGEGGEPTPTSDGDVVASASGVPEGLVALETDRDPHSAPVVDWQVGWSPDGQVLGLWVADSAGSSWGALTVFSLDIETGLVQGGEALLGPTLARRGFSLGADRVAWVAPSDDNVDGELRIRTWGSDGVGGLRVISPEQEEVLPAF